ncbi:MAG: M48 family metallopeptidase [Candidatus Omnitrophica bacterium]|nr:M48 family metallopeptidase [Candidatus Omnitrophota bacterium]
MDAKLRILIWFLLVFQLGCASVPITGRKQFVMIPAAELNVQAAESYRNILSQSVLSNDPKKLERVSRIGKKIALAAEDFLKQNGQAYKISEYKWEFNLVEEDDTLNAFCLPGGKVVVYTGIMKLADNDNALAVVIAHEIAHAIANHGAERMSQILLAQFGQKTLSAATKESSQSTKEFLDLAYGLGANLGIVLPYSRLHENEADHIGLILMAKAGYDPTAAIVFWEKMQKQSGNKTPEFLSTHPLAQTRIDNIKAILPKALEYYKK